MTPAPLLKFDSSFREVGMRLEKHFVRCLPRLSTGLIAHSGVSTSNRWVLVITAALGWRFSCHELRQFDELHKEQRFGIARILLNKQTD